MTDCSCIKGESNFNFKFESLSSSIILFEDLSDWMEHPNYKDPVSYSITITPPGSSDVTVLINLSRTNKITSNELFGREGDIPDGIYCIKLSNCGYTYTRFKAITYKLNCCADKLFLEGKDTTEIDDLIRKIKIATEFQDSVTAIKLYKIASEKIKLNNCYC